MVLMHKRALRQLNYECQIQSLICVIFADLNALRHIFSCNFKWFSIMK